MHKPWLEQYPDGVPATVDLNRYGTLVDVLDHAFSRFASRDALCCMDERITYGAIDKLSLAFGAWLQSLAWRREHALR